MFACTKGNSSWYLKGKISLKMAINESDIHEYERSIEFIVKYFKGNN